MGTLSFATGGMVSILGLSEPIMTQSADQANDLTYTERISSNKTEALFLFLMILVISLLIWRLNVGGWEFLDVIFLFYHAPAG